MIKIDWEKIPNSPGVYLWKGYTGQVIYVGKAKNLRKRMRQYFDRDLSPKNMLLIKNIKDFDFQVTENEIDALILEQTLINDYEPKFNIKIKSSKIYPYIEVRKEPKLSILITKKTKNKNSKYFGPYPDGYYSRNIIKIIQSAIPIDKCYSPNSGTKCINYEMGRCLGYCFKNVSKQEEDFTFNMVVDFLSGKVKYVEDKLKEKLKLFNESEQYEESKKTYEFLENILKIKEEQSHTFSDSKHRDVFNFYEKDEYISISIMHIRFGNISFTSNYISKKFNPDKKDSFESLLNTFYINKIIPDEIIVPFELKWDYTLKDIITIPKKGLKKTLLDIVYKNAKSKYENKIETFMNKVKTYEEAQFFLRENIEKKEFTNIEMMDISSTMGDQQVGAVVSFKNGEPNKSLYRKYIIKEINKMDDYAATEEVVRRHFENKINNNLEIPDLFIIDGKHQLSIAKNVFKKLDINNVTLVALKKDKNHNTNSLIKDNLEEIKLNKDTPPYLFLSKLQDEVHRFVISFHRQRREKAILTSSLDKYTFLNQEDKNKLFKEFKSIRKIMISTVDDLSKVIGSKKAKKMKEEKNG